MYRLQFCAGCGRSLFAGYDAGALPLRGASFGLGDGLCLVLQALRIGGIDCRPVIVPIPNEEADDQRDHARSNECDLGEFLGSRQRRSEAALDEKGGD